MKTKSFLLVATLFVIVSCADNTGAGKVTKVSLRQEWFPYSGYAGEVFAVNETAAKYNLDIKLEAGSDQIDPIKLVLSGENNFGVVSADRILQANEKGANLVVIGAVNYTSPTCFITKQASGIVTPQDFKGKTVGVLTGTNTELIYKILKTKTGLNNVTLKEVEIPFDLGTFISGGYDVRPGFVYDEPVSLDLKNVKYNIIKPSDYGIKFIGTVYFTTRRYLQAHPQVVENFVYAIADGWKAAVKDPQKAIHYLKLFDNSVDSTREILSLQKGIDYFKGENNKFLFASESTWKEMAGELISIKAISSFDFSKTVLNDYVNKYNSK